MKWYSVHRIINYIDTNFYKYYYMEKQESLSSISRFKRIQIGLKNKVTVAWILLWVGSLRYLMANTDMRELSTIDVTFDDIHNIKAKMTELYHLDFVTTPYLWCTILFLFSLFLLYQAKLSKLTVKFYIKAHEKYKEWWKSELYKTMKRHIEEWYYCTILWVDIAAKELGHEDMYQECLKACWKKANINKIHWRLLSLHK